MKSDEERGKKIGKHCKTDKGPLSKRLLIVVTILYVCGVGMIFSLLLFAHKQL